MGPNVSSRDARECSTRSGASSRRCASRRARRRSAPGLSGAQLFVLRTLAESPGLSLNELAERTRTHQSSVSAVVTRLTRERLVERGTATGDARRAVLSLSARGHSRLRTAPRTAQERLIVAVDGLPAADRRRLAATLNRLVDGMGLTTRRPAAMFDEPAENSRRGGYF